MKKVYLAGGVTGLSMLEANIWRNIFDMDLRSASNGRIEGVNPLRGYEYLETNQEDAGKVNENFYLTTPKAIFARCKNDCLTSDVVFVNGLGNKISIGTVMEISFAHIKGIPIVLLENERKFYTSHPMVAECIDFVVNDWESAIECLIGIL